MLKNVAADNHTSSNLHIQALKSWNLNYKKGSLSRSCVRYGKTCLRSEETESCLNPEQQATHSKLRHPFRGDIPCNTTSPSTPNLST